MGVKPDPLAEALLGPPYLIDDFDAEAARIRAALDAAGYEVRPKFRASADEADMLTNCEDEVRRLRAAARPKPPVRTSKKVEYVECDDDCKALDEPVTLEEFRAALEHWEGHGVSYGCSHGR